MQSVQYRDADGSDAAAVAALHADSWRRYYRGAYTDEFLDGPVGEERLSEWSARLGRPSASATIVAEIDGEVVGLVHLVFDSDPQFGALLDNLHVRHDAQRRGIGAELMTRAADALVRERPGQGMYLWVLEQNARAQAFYRSIGGQEADREASIPPGGGRIVGIRYVWPDPGSILRGRSDQHPGSPSEP